MLVKKRIFIYLIILTIVMSFLIYNKFSNNNEMPVTTTDIPEDTIYSSNLIENVFYTSKDAHGNEYIIKASKGEIDHSNSNILFLTNVKAKIKLKKSSDVTISSDYGKYNINCNAVLPGYFKTDMNKKSLNNKSKRIKRENLTMLGRWGDLNELVGVILFLATKNAKYITGQKIIVDGGIVSKGL